MDFMDLDLKELDRDLSEDQRREWNAIYASYRAKSALTGCVVGTDTTTITMKNPETGKPERAEIHCLVVIQYRVKVLIPAQDIWFDENTTRPLHVLRSMTGATVDYVITGIDRQAECCTASRREAMVIRRRSFYRFPPTPGQRIPVDVLAVGPHRMLVTYSGFDKTLSPSDLSYAMISDLRERYHPGEIITAILKSTDNTPDEIRLSVKEAEPHPFDGAEARHPVRSRRSSVITGKYKGGVFCKLEENLDCLCTYSIYQCDEDFSVGDQVIVAITKYDYERKLVYGKIVAKW